MEIQGLCEISQFKKVVPKNILKQEEVALWMAALNGKEKDESMQEIYKKRFLRYSVNPDRISSRAFENLEIGDYDSLDGPSNGTGLEKQSQKFLKRADEVFDEIYDEEESAPQHMIHVTCTGYSSPSAPQKQVDKKKWYGDTDVTHAYHMGCYASMPATRMASAFVAGHNASKQKDQDFRVDVIHTEMCGLHQNPDLSKPEQIVIHSLFADGHMKYSLSPVGTAKKGFRLLSIKEQIIPESTKQMSWIPENWGFKMGLGKEVPSLIASHLKGFLSDLLEDAELSWEEAQKEAIFAVHPGGPKIIDLVEENLGLTSEQVKESKKVLYERGNMSSATLPHIWEGIFNNQYQSGRYMISLAFGPGLSIFGAVYKLI